MKAALYARFSTDLQRAAGIEDQFRNCRKRAELEGWKIVATLVDAAMSGSDANRPQYRVMMDAAARREFDVLIVDDLSRLTRVLQTTNLNSGQAEGFGPFRELAGAARVLLEARQATARTEPRQFDPLVLRPGARRSFPARFAHF